MASRPPEVEQAESRPVESSAQIATSGRKRGMALFMVNQQSLWTMKYRSKSGAATRAGPRSPQRGRLQHQGDFVAVGESESGASRGKVFSPKRVAGSRGHAAQMRRKREV